MAVVYRARDLLNQRKVAVKLLHADTKSSFAVEHFLREAEILAALHHPHIVPYIAHGRTPSGEAYLAMEWLDGEDLAQRLNRGPLRLSETLRLATLVADALSATHEHGIVHRDLKPSNLFLRQGDIEQVMLLDFGVARRLAAPRVLTQTGAVVGTPEYMSPEQATGEKVDWRSDQYSLGCILYEMLTGELPFTGKSAFEVMNQHLNEPPVPLRQRRPELAASIPAPLEKLVLGMMQKKPIQRYPSMRAVEQGLRDVVAAMRQAPPAAAPPPAAKTLLMTRGQPNAPLMNEVPQAPETTLRNGVSADELDRVTKPLMPALHPSGPPPAAPTLLSEPKTLILGGSMRGQPGAPLLLDKLAVKVKVPSLPELPRARFWERSALLRWLYGRLRAFFRLLIRRG